MAGRVPSYNEYFWTILATILLGAAYFLFVVLAIMNVAGNIRMAKTFDICSAISFVLTVCGILRIRYLNNF